MRLCLAPSSMVPLMPSDNESSWWTSSPLHSVRPTLFYFTFLFIYCFLEQLHNPSYRLLESPPNTPPSNWTSTSSSASPLSRSVHLDRALQYYKSASPCPSLSSSPSSSRSSTLPGSRMTSWASSRASLSLPQVGPKTPLPRAPWSAAPTGSWAAGVERWSGVVRNLIYW